MTKASYKSSRRCPEFLRRELGVMKTFLVVVQLRDGAENKAISVGHSVIYHLPLRSSDMANDIERYCTTLQRLISVSYNSNERG